MESIRDSTGIKKMSRLEVHPIFSHKEFMVQVNMEIILLFPILLKWKEENSVIWNVIHKRKKINFQIKIYHLLLQVRVHLHLNLTYKGEFYLERYIWVNLIIIMYYSIKTKEKVIVNIKLKDSHFKLEKNQDPKQKIHIKYHILVQGHIIIIWICYQKQHSLIKPQSIHIQHRGLLLFKKCDLI